MTTSNDPYCIANTFAKFWCESSSDANYSHTFVTSKANINTTATHSNPSHPGKKIDSDIRPIELISSVNSLKGHTPGMDRISYPMIKHAMPILKNRLTKHFNNIYNSYIPQQYKTSIVIPIYKNNQDKTRTESYRPISLNQCISKVLDTIIAKRLWWFVEYNTLISKNQFGFKRNKSVIDCLIYADHLITNSIYKRKHKSIVSLDFSKAFDRTGVHAVIEQLIEWNEGPKML